MKNALLLGLLCVVAACHHRPDSGGFYSYVDAQGNPVTVPRESQPSPKQTAEGRDDGAHQMESLDESGLEASKEEYLTDEQVQQRLEKRQRDRFVIYTDASGYQVTQPVDVVEVRRARQSQGPGYDEMQYRLEAFVERVEEVPLACCMMPLSAARVLKVSDEQLVSFRRPPVQWVKMPQQHPAMALRLDPGVNAVRVQTFLTGKGYLHPQAVFLNEQGVPIVLVDNLFSRRYPQTWAKLAYLQGELPVEPGAAWLVLYLGYAGQDAAGRPELVPGQYLWAEPSSPLALEGELVVRGLAEAP